MEHRNNTVMVQNFYTQAACNFQDYQNHFSVALPNNQRFLLKHNDVSNHRFLLNFKTPSVATVKHFSTTAQGIHIL